MDELASTDKGDFTQDIAFSAVTPVSVTLLPEVAEWVQAAIERLAENPTLTENLTDDTARIVLDWTEGEVWRLVLETELLDVETASETLTPKLRYLRRYVRRAAKLSAASDDPIMMLQSLLNSPLTYPEDDEG